MGRARSCTTSTHEAATREPQPPQLGAPVIEAAWRAIEQLNMPLDMRWLALVACAAVLGGFMRGFVGFGGALALVPVLALALGPKLAVAVASIVGLPSVLQLLPEAVRHAERKLVLPAAVATLAGAPLGSLLLVSVEPRMMTGAIGVMVIAMALATWRPWPSAFVRRAWVPIAAGAISGMLQGAAGVGGPPSVAVALARGGSPSQQRGNVLGLLTTIATGGAISHWWFGLFTQQAAVMAAFLLPLFFGATWAGSRFFAMGGQRHFRVAALGILLVIGVATVAVAVRGG